MKIIDNLKNYMGDGRFITIMFIMAFTFINLSLMIVLATHSIQGFEESLYDVYPLYFWIFIFISCIIGQMSLLVSVHYQIKDKFRFLSVFTIFLTSIILIAMPLLRGYAIYGREDVLTHIGFMKDILLMGHIGNSNFYPIEHILGTSISLFTNFSLSYVTEIVPLFFFVFYSLSCYILFKEVFEKKEEIALALSLSIIPIFNVFMFAPNLQAFLVLPFLIYLFLKSRGHSKTLEFTILLIILILCLVFFHPIIIMASLVIIFVITALSKRRKEKFKTANNIILIGIVSILTWQSYVYLLTQNVRRIFSFLNNELSSQYQANSEILNEASPNLIDLISYIINIYGIWIIYGLISLFSIFFLIKIFRKKHESSKFYYEFSAILFFVFLVLSCIVFFMVSSFGFQRIYAIALIFSLILIPTFYYTYIKSNKTKLRKVLVFGLISILLIFTSYNIIFNSLPSSRTQLDNNQVTDGEISGMNFFFSTYNKNNAVLEWGISLSRFHDLMYGYDLPKSRISYWGREKYPPNHFGYDNYTSFNESVNGSTYFLLSTQGENHYEYRYGEKYKAQWRFYRDDFSRLNNDNGVNLIFSNGDLKTYLTR